MASTLSPAKVVLLAVHFAGHADIESLAALTATHASILHDELLLRIILTHLPETTSPGAYIGFLQNLVDHVSEGGQLESLDTSPVDSLDDGEAAKRATKLHLLPLLYPCTPETSQGDALTRFLFLRIHKMDEETGMLAQLLDLLLPFLSRNSAIQKWAMATVLPYVRKGLEFRMGQPPEYSLAEFEKLTDQQAVEFLLSPAGSLIQPRDNVDHYLRSVVGPWLYDIDRWDCSRETSGDETSSVFCPGWQHVREWLLSQATLSWSVAALAIERWGGPDDVEFGDGIPLCLPAPYKYYLERTYATTVMACVYGVQERTLECLTRMYSLLTTLRQCLRYGMDVIPLEQTINALPDLSVADISTFHGGQVASFMRNSLLEQHNPLTKPSQDSTKFLLALVLSAYLLTLFGSPSSVRRAGELSLLQDERDQKAEVLKLLRGIAGHAPNESDDYLQRARLSLLWLRDWGKGSTGTGLGESAPQGAFGMVAREYIEAEFLKLLLSRERYNLARNLYDKGGLARLPADTVQESVYQAALSAFDNATNPNRTRGGLKRCGDIINALPGTVIKSMPGTKRILALLKATHALSNYRLVLKQGEPFSPVVLRVHSDPISIISKVLEQNPRAYTRLQEFLEMGMNMVRAGIPSHNRSDSAGRSASIVGQQPAAEIAERRITAMCIEAALREEDFETAYSYVASRLSTQSSQDPDTLPWLVTDEWSWKAALQAGQYVRTERSQQPTHLGTGSGNLEIRHLEQRIECLATALRVAPTSQLQEILKSFRRCEEQLDSAIKEEVASEAAWYAEDRPENVPGAFDYASAERQYPTRKMTGSAAARQTEEAPMSLIDLSRATARAAQRNFSSIPSLQSIAQGDGSDKDDPELQPHSRLRKRDQLREVATGTLVSGVGWLIGANVAQDKEEGN